MSRPEFTLCGGRRRGGRFGADVLVQAGDAVRNQGAVEKPHAHRAAQQAATAGRAPATCGKETDIMRLCVVVGRSVASPATDVRAGLVGKA
ncbi:MAG: hypothetical protein QME76_09830 [Bacillota bacterium]|nr:hypothetical protein [Bacillota bacterium]